MSKKYWMSQPHLNRLNYDFQNLKGVAIFDEQTCPDMTECIEYFQMIDPGVNEILTYMADVPDIIYKKLPDIGWKAFWAKEIK